MNPSNKTTLVSVILPIKYNAQISYTLPSIYQVERGSRVMVDFAGKIYSGVVDSIYTIDETSQEHNNQNKPNNSKKINYKPILKVEELPKVTETELKFWLEISNYYLCSIGEVYKTA